MKNVFCKSIYGKYVKMRVAIHDADGGKYPNLALLKLAAWHKACGDTVDRFMALYRYGYDRVYSSKVFSWTKLDSSLPDSSIKGGTGYDGKTNLPDEVEHFCPDYAFAGIAYSMGFLTRGCIRSCPWCVVPAKEGAIRPHADITEFTRHRHVKLMDNNILALPDYAATQFEKMARLGLRVDFNQGLDARLIDMPIARRLAALSWWEPLRLACDTKAQMPEVARAVRLLRQAGVKPVRYNCYVLVKSIDDALDRVEFLRALNVTPFAQPYRPAGSTEEPHEELKRFARWVNLRPVFKTTDWQGYKDGFKYVRARNGNLQVSLKLV
jgi:hypothetical protein